MAVAYSGEAKSGDVPATAAARDRCRRALRRVSDDGKSSSRCGGERRIQRWSKASSGTTVARTASFEAARCSGGQRGGHSGGSGARAGAQEGACERGELVGGLGGAREGRGGVGRGNDVVEVPDSGEGFRQE